MDRNRDGAAYQGDPLGGTAGSAAQITAPLDLIPNDAVGSAPFRAVAARASGANMLASIGLYANSAF